ncbi:AMP-binding protein [Rhodoligotrophos defluvii]|uniref:AMP-binding protein n=1 Tax=Rhodoligotrophos defluvii TaxID=2561934 RepID=UPI0010C99976|nr:AMP-binding protein [Rhodoligotrophos defluvii]
MGARDFTLADVAARNSELWGERTAFLYGDERVSHAAHFERVQRLAAGLAAAGVRPGERVAIISRNNQEFVELIGAAAVAGAIIVPVNWRLADEEIAYILDDSEPVLVIADEAQQPRLAAISEARDATLPSYGIGTLHAGFAPVSALYGEPQEAQAEVAADQPFVMLYTAATDGRPKGALISHGGLLSGSEEPLRCWGVTEQDVNLAILPLFHLAGLVMLVITQRAGGASAIFDDFDAAAVVQAVRACKGSLLGEFPPVLDTLLNTAQPGDLDSLRVVVGLDTAETIGRLEREWPKAAFWSVFGQSETSGFVTLSPHAARPGSAGRPTLQARVRVVDEYDRLLPPGQTGEIVVRGPGVFLGYWKRPQDSEFTLRNGWHHTGDLGQFDEDGYLWYKGRTPAKELIKSGGENVYPSEVEQVIAAHPAIAEVSVIGVPDQTRGETIKAICVLRPGCSASETEIADFVAARIARFKRPKYVAFVESLPKQPNGLIDRGLVKERHAHG